MMSRHWVTRAELARRGALATFACVAGLTLGCAPTVKVEAPDKPIVINLNVKIEHEIRIKVDDQLDAIFAENEDLFGEGE